MTATEQIISSWFVVEPTLAAPSATIFSMDIRKEPRVVATDRFDGDVIVSFAHNRGALYPASFLYRSLPLVQELREAELNSDGAENPSGDDSGSVSREVSYDRM